MNRLCDERLRTREREQPSNGTKKGGKRSRKRSLYLLFVARTVSLFFPSFFLFFSLTKSCIKELPPDTQTTVGSYVVVVVRRNKTFIFVVLLFLLRLFGCLASPLDGTQLKRENEERLKSIYKL